MILTDQLFSDKRKFTKIKYGLNDTIRVKKKEDILIIDPFTPSNMNFQTILMPKVNLANFFRMLLTPKWY